jgi:hypothetical protein
MKFNNVAGSFIDLNPLRWFYGKMYGASIMIRVSSPVYNFWGEPRGIGMSVKGLFFEVQNENMTRIDESSVKDHCAKIVIK